VDNTQSVNVDEANCAVSKQPHRHTIKQITNRMRQRHYVAHERTLPATQEQSDPLSQSVRTHVCTVRSARCVRSAHLHHQHAILRNCLRCGQCHRSHSGRHKQIQSSSRHTRCRYAAAHARLTPFALVLRVSDHRARRQRQSTKRSNPPHTARHATSAIATTPTPPSPIRLPTAPTVSYFPFAFAGAAAF